jgi:hypothetical protein
MKLKEWGWNVVNRHARSQLALGVGIIFDIIYFYSDFGLYIQREINSVNPGNLKLVGFPLIFGIT